MAVDRPSGDLGKKLREARERKGVSLRQIANSTKIAVSVLEALERNDISRLPGGIFGRAFVRSFAAEIGLDPETVIQEFIAQFPDDSVTAGHPQSEQLEDNEALESDRRMASTFLRLLALSIPIAAVVVYFTTGGRLQPAAPPEPPARQAPVPARAAPERAEPAQAPGAGPAAADAPAGRLAVTLAASRACWVVATVDGEKQIERLLRPGDEPTLEVRDEIELTVGDAEALALTINGLRARPLGKAGEVVTTRITLANFKDYLAGR